MEDLLLKDYSPRSSLVLEEHTIERPRFPAIEAHNHLGFATDAFGDANPSGGTGATDDPAALVATQDEVGLRAMANLTGRWGDDLKRLLDRYEGRYPGRFFTFANVDWSGFGEPGFGERAARQLEESVRAGARGLKVFKALGLRVRDASGRLAMPDDARLDPLWAKAGELKVPVLIHVADPASFFEPNDRFNESYLSLQQHPDWDFSGPQFPAFLDLIHAGIRMMARHPGTTFITAHTGWYSENLKFVGEQMLDRLPNVYTDFSARITYLGRQPRAAREFFVRYQDRILFGTDETPVPATYRLYYRFLETADEHFETRPGRWWPRISGLALPDDVLEKVYHKNAERVIPGLA